MKSFTQQRNNLLPLVPQLRQALRWWSIPANLASSAPIRDAPPTVHLWTDASTSGFGAHNDSGGYIQGHWSEAHIGLHINAKELLAIALALESELVPKQSSTVIFTDSKVAFFTVKNKGSNRSTVLQSIEDRVLKATELKNLSILPIHLKGESNVTADALSRDKPIPSEWTLTHQAFQALIREVGWKPQVDLMATPENTKLHTYISPYQVMGAAGVDFFATNLKQFTRVYLFPPQKLILKCLVRLLQFQGRAIIIAPLLPSQPWFPVLKDRASHCWKILDPPFQIVQGIRIDMPSKQFSKLRAWII